MVACQKKRQKLMETSKIAAIVVPIEGEHVDLISALIAAPSPLGLRAFMLTGPAGTGKTAVTRQIANSIQATYTYIQCTAGMDEGELLYKLLPSEETAAGVKIVPGKLIESIEASCKGKTVLVLDEWDKTRPSADAFLLDFLQNGRVSWRINGASTIVGSAENLVVFLTSNAEREFSEPLLRRVITIKTQALAPASMYQVLAKYGVCAGHLPLLVQLYADTQAARLDKPATVQELVQLEQALHVLGDKADWDQLAYSFVIKTDEAWEQLSTYLARAGTSRKLVLDQERASIVEKYNEPAQIPTPVPAPITDEQPRMPRLAAKLAQIAGIVTPAQAAAGEQSLVMSDDDSVASSNIIKAFLPVPTKDPAKFGAFSIIEEGGKKIVRESPLTFNEITSGVFTSSEKSETFADDDMPNMSYDSFVPLMLQRSTRVLYYTRNTSAGEIATGKYGDGVVTWRTTRCNEGIRLQVHTNGKSDQAVKNLLAEHENVQHKMNYRAVKHAACRIAAILSNNHASVNASVSVNLSENCVFSNVAEEDCWSASLEQIDKVLYFLKASIGHVQPAGASTKSSIIITVLDNCTVVWAIGSHVAAHVKYEAGMLIGDVIARLEAAIVVLAADKARVPNSVSRAVNFLARIKNGEDLLKDLITETETISAAGVDIVVPGNPSGDVVVAEFITAATATLAVVAENSKKAVEMVKTANRSIAARKAAAAKKEGEQV